MTVYKLELLGSFLGERDNNIFFYQGDGPFDPSVLLDAFLQYVLPAMLAIKQEDYEALGVIISDALNDIFPPSEVTLSGWVGEKAGDPGASYQQWSYLLKRVTSNVKSGGKRVGAVAEGMTDGNFPAGSALNDLNALSAELQAIFVYGGGARLFPIIFRPPERDPNGNAQGSPIAYAQLQKLSTMDSRKEGQGPPAPAAFTGTLLVDKNSFAPAVTFTQEKWSTYLAGGGTVWYIDGQTGPVENKVTLT